MERRVLTPYFVIIIHKQRDKYCIADRAALNSRVNISRMDVDEKVPPEYIK